MDEAREAGVVAFDTETTSLDPMQAELCGFSIATAPRRMGAISGSSGTLRFDRDDYLMAGSFQA